jgi:hypothetical protein
MRLTSARKVLFVQRRQAKLTVVPGPGWYASTVRLQDGSILVLGGMIAGGFNNVEVRMVFVATTWSLTAFFPGDG